MRNWRVVLGAVLISCAVAPDLEAEGVWWLATEAGVAASNDGPAQRGLAMGIAIERRIGPGAALGVEVTSSSFDRKFDDIFGTWEANHQVRLLGAFVRVDLLPPLATRPFLSVGFGRYDFTSELPSLFAGVDSTGAPAIAYGERSAGDFDASLGGGLAWRMGRRTEGAVEFRFHRLLEANDGLRHSTVFLRLVFNLDR